MIFKLNIYTLSFIIKVFSTHVFVTHAQNGKWKNKIHDRQKKLQKMFPFVKFKVCT